MTIAGGILIFLLASIWIYAIVRIASKVTVLRHEEDERN